MRLILLILDGWGIRKARRRNAIAQASTPVMDELLRAWPHASLAAHGKAVGLPKGTQGNSEVGHITLGAGRVVPQMLTRINDSIKDGSFFRNASFMDVIDHCKQHDSTLHIMGLVQDQGVHALSAHALALIELCRQQDFHKIAFHCFTDGRDTHPRSAKRFVQEIEHKLKKTKTGRITTVIGRFYAMDRDHRYARTKRAYDAIVSGRGRKVNTACKAIQQAYQKGETDEFIVPTIIGNYKGARKHDGMIFFNYRYDRARQLTKALTEPVFTDFRRREHPKLRVVAMTPYYPDIKAKIAFKERHLRNILGGVLAKHRFTQLRVAETEKYAHVTYFFNGQEERRFPGEDRRLSESTRKVKTYDKQPAMSAREVTRTVTKAIEDDDHDVIIANFANADMVGHTGDFAATKEAVEIIDECIGKIIKGVPFPVVITADHGNAEQMEGKLQTSHTTHPVPFVIVNNSRKLRKGGLADVAPTILELLRIPKPEEMTGSSLLL